MSQKTVKLGQKVRFDPYKERGIGKPDMEGPTTGTVDYINEPHRWFGVTYGPGLRTSFLLCQVGEDVTIYG